MVASYHNPDDGSAPRKEASSRSNEAQPYLDEPPLLCSREERWHDWMIVGFLALMLIVSAVGLVTTLVDLLTMLR